MIRVLESAPGARLGGQPFLLAVDSYVNFARRQPWQEAVCASLMELFAPSIHRERLTTWPVHYTWIETSGFEYFRSRDCLPTRDAQARALEILRFKLDLLWSILDSVQLRYGLEGECDSPATA
jgi:pyrroloquinoline-quinone synthase